MFCKEGNSVNKYLFFVKDMQNIPVNEALQLSEGFRFANWSPEFFKMVPNGLPSFRHRLVFLSLWLVQYLLLRNKYTVYLIYKDDEVVHYTSLLPKSFAFPHMEKHDLHLYGSWTDENARGKGFFYFTMAYIIQNNLFPRRCFWWHCLETNQPSINCALKLGYYLYGSGKVSRKWGIRFLTVYNILERY